MRTIEIETKKKNKEFCIKNQLYLKVFEICIVEYNKKEKEKRKIILLNYNFQTQTKIIF